MQDVGERDNALNFDCMIRFWLCLNASVAQRVLSVYRLSMVGGIKRVAGGADIDYTRDFFGKRAYLTVSGQLNGEYYASALSNIYTFGPTFRAENSHTSRHLAEFWMIEPEMAFCALEDDMQCAEDYVRHCCAHLLKSSKHDLDFLIEKCVLHSKRVSSLPHVLHVPSLIS
jgi:asparaginyl-tRNA synthetase